MIDVWWPGAQSGDPVADVPVAAERDTTPMVTTVLLVEDEPNIAALLRTYLERDGLNVIWARSGSEALVALGRRLPGLVVLDLGLPDLDGLDLARRIGASTPVIMLTARDEEDERMAGFAAGADDYVAKPFSPREVVARVRAVLRRASDGRHEAAEQELRAGPVSLCPAAREARLDGHLIELTAKEFDLLAQLVRNAGMVMTRDVLLERVWGLIVPGQTRTVDQHVAQLRQKLGRPDLIRTVRGLGYKVASGE